MRAAQTAAVFVVVLVLAQPAMALAPGVFVSPGSPAGKEYSFPLSVLRGNGAGQSAPGGATQPLFGVGITPARGATGANAAARRSRHHGAGAGHGRNGGGTGGGPHAPSAVVPGTRRANAVLASLVRSSSVVPQIALITVALVLIGAAFGAGIAVAKRRS